MIGTVFSSLFMIFIQSAWGRISAGSLPFCSLSTGFLKAETIFDALEWPRQKAAGCPENGTMGSNVPNEGGQMVRYYGHDSNVARGKRKKQVQDGLIPSIISSLLKTIIGNL